MPLNNLPPTAHSSTPPSPVWLKPFGLALLVGLLLGPGCQTRQQFLEGHFQGLAGGKSTDRYPGRWEAIAKADAQGRSEKALRLSLKLYRKARRKGNPVQQIRALQNVQQLHRSSVDVMPEYPFQLLKRAAARGRQPAKGVLEGMLATQYMDTYYHIQAAMIDSQKALPQLGNPEMLTWPGERFYDSAGRYWLKALADRQQLAQLYSGVFAPLLTGDSATRKQRPSIFDLLAHQAIDFFRKGSNQTATQGISGGKRLFASPENWRTQSLANLHGDAAYRKALRIYQQLEAVHQTDTFYPALLHAALERLRFAHEYAALPSEKRRQYYYSALDTLIRQAPDTPVIALAYFRQAKLIKQGYEPSGQRFVSRLSLAVEKAQTAIAQYPDSYGSDLCQRLIQRIRAPELSLKVQQTHRPYQPGRIKLTYANVDSVYYRLIPVPPKQQPAFKQRSRTKLLQTLKQEPVAYQLQKALPVSGLYQRATTKLGMPALKPGGYALIAASTGRSEASNPQRSVHFFQVSDLRILSIGPDADKTESYRVVDATSGQPVPDVQLRGYKQDTAGSLVRASASVATDSNGQAALTTESHPSYLLCVNEPDRLLVRTQPLDADSLSSGPAQAFASGHSAPNNPKHSNDSGFRTVSRQVPPTDTHPFQLSLKAQSPLYPIDSQVTIQGQLYALEGVPVAKRVIQYNVRRMAYLPVSGRTYQLPPYATGHIASKTDTSNRDGAFRLTFQAEGWPGAEAYPTAVFQYQVQARVKNAPQHTWNSAFVQVLASRRQSIAALKGPNWIQRGKPGCFRAQQYSITGKPRQDSLKMHFVKVSPAAQLYRKQYWNPPDYVPESAKAFHLKYPYDPYERALPQVHERPIKDTMLTLTIPANTTYTVPAEIMKDWEAGTYRALLTPGQAQGREGSRSEASKAFRIFEAEAGPAVKEFSYFIPQRVGATPDTPAKVFWGSAASDAWAYAEIRRQGQRLHDTFIRTDRGHRPYPMPDRIGASGPAEVHIAVINQNRIYRHRATIMTGPDKGSGGSGLTQTRDTLAHLQERLSKPGLSFAVSNGAAPDVKATRLADFQPKAYYTVNNTKQPIIEAYGFGLSKNQIPDSTLSRKSLRGHFERLKLSLQEIE